MQTIKEMFNQYKWTLLAGMIVAALIAVITAHLHVLQFMNCKIHNDQEGMLTILQQQAKNVEVQDDWFFKQGMGYLLKQDEYSEEMTQFFEEQFEIFTPEWKKEIIKAYSRKRKNLVMSKEVMSVLIQYIQDEEIKSYISRLSLDDFEQGLTLMYGNNPEINDGLIDSLYEVLSVYPEKLKMTKFQFDLYSVLYYQGDHAEQKIKLLLSKIEPNVAKENLFKQLRNKELGEKELVKWIEFFNNTGVIAGNEYTSFKEIYGNICMVRKQYQELDAKEADLKAKKDEVEVMIGNKVKELEEKKGKVNGLQKEVDELQASLDRLTDGYYMSLYLERASGTGSNEYIASNPRTGFLGLGNRPSDLKYIVKLKSTSFVKEGVYNLNVYAKGTKSGSNGEEYSYYEEVSEDDLAQIDSIYSEKENKQSELDTIKQQVSQGESEINAIKEQYQYDENVKALQEITTLRGEYSNKVEEEVIKIRKLLGLNHIKIEISAATNTVSQ